MAKKLKKQRSQQKAAKKRAAKKQRKQAKPQKVSELTKHDSAYKGELRLKEELLTSLLTLEGEHELSSQESSDLDIILAEVKRRYEAGDRSWQFRQMINAACEFVLDMEWEIQFWQRAESFLFMDQLEETPITDPDQLDDAYNTGQQEVCNILGLNHQDWIRSEMDEADIIAPFKELS